MQLRARSTIKNASVACYIASRELELQANSAHSNNDKCVDEALLQEEFDEGQNIDSILS